MRRATVVALCIASIGHSIAASPAEFVVAQEEMRFQADSTDLDLKTNRSTSYNVTMTQGGWTLIAGEATLEWQNDEHGEWQLNGRVRLRGPGTEIDADVAKVAVASNRIQSVILTGQPATFGHYVEQQGKVAEGKAQSVQYDLESNSVSLTGDAFLAMGQYELTNATIHYYLNEQRVVANNPPPSTGRVKGRIKRQKDERGSGAPAR